MPEYTAVQDVIVPDKWVPYVIQRSAELTAFFDSGIIMMDPEFARLAGTGGTSVNMPFWNDLAGRSQVLSDTAQLDTKKIGASKDFAAIHNRGDAWKVNDLAKYLSGDDPAGAIGDLVAAYWARDHEHTAIMCCNGIFAAGNMSTNVHSISTQGTPGVDNYLLGSSFIDAKQKLGDNSDKLTGMAVHSMTEAQLRKADLIDFALDSEGKPTIKYYQGLRLVVDDNCPVDDGGAEDVYTSYLFGPGAFGFGVDPTDEPIRGGFGSYQVEFSREALAHNSVMINRRRYILHPRGIKWLGTTVAGLSPTDDELAIGTNWTRVYDVKNIRLVAIQHNVG